MIRCKLQRMLMSLYPRTQEEKQRRESHNERMIPTQTSRNLSPLHKEHHHTVQFSSVAQSCRTLCDPMDYSMSGLPVHHQLLELTQTHVHRVADATQPSHPLSSSSPPAFNLSQHQSLPQRVSSSHQAAKVLGVSASAYSFQ